MVELIRRSIERLARLLQGVIVTLALAMLAVLTLQVFMRFVFGLALSWSEEFALTCFSWCMLLAIALGVRDAMHVRLDLLSDLLPALPRSALERLVLLAIAGFGVTVAWAGYGYVLDSLGTTSAAIGFPIAYLYASAPAAGALIALFGLEAAFFGTRSATTAATAATAADTEAN